MILSTLESVPGQVIIEHYGGVSGSTVRSKHAGRDFMAGLKNFFGGGVERLYPASGGIAAGGDRPHGPRRRKIGRERHREYPPCDQLGYGGRGGGLRLWHGGQN